jgi:O-antigen ligase
MPAYENTRIPFYWLLSIFIASLLVSVYSQQYFLALLPFCIILFYTGWKFPAIMFLFLLASIPFSFEFNFTPSLGTDIPDEGLMILVSFLFIAWLIYRPTAIDKESLSHPLLVLLYIHLAWITLTVLLSSDRLLSLKFLLAKGWYLGAFVLAPIVLFREKKWIVRSALVLATAMFAVAVITIFRHYGHGFSFIAVNESVSPFFRNHVNYSAMLVCTLPVLLAFYLLAGNKTLQKLVMVVIAVMLIALFFSYARGAWLAFAGGLAAWWLTRRKLLVTAYCIMIVLVSAIAIWLQSNQRYLDYAHDYRTTVFHEDFSQHLVATYKLKDVSTAERFYRWVAGVRMVRDEPLTGFGPNTFYNNYKPYTIPAYKTWVSDNPEHSTVHNYFLLLLIEQGLPGLLIFLILVGGILYYAQRLYHQLKDPFYRISALAAGMIVVMISIVNFLSDLIETDKVGSLFFLCFSLLVMIDRNNRRISDSSPHIERVT